MAFKNVMFMLGLLAVAEGGGGIPYALCLSSCIAACSLLAAPCIVACTAACAPYAACFSDDTMICANDNANETQPGVPVVTPVWAVQSGDMVWTRAEGQHLLTKVIHNIRMEGNFGFVHLTAEDDEGETYRAVVTEEHHSPRVLKMSAESSGRRAIATEVDEHSMEVVLAKEVRIGDLIPVLGRHGFRSATVVSVSWSQQRWKNVLITEAGTVLLANGLLTTTVCDGSEALQNHVNFSAALEYWRALHHPWFKSPSKIDDSLKLHV